MEGGAIEEVVAMQVSSNFGYLALAHENGAVSLYKMPAVVDPVVHEEGELRIETDLENRWQHVFEYRESELKLTEWAVELPFLKMTSRLSKMIARAQIPYSKPFLYFNKSEKVTPIPNAKASSSYTPQAIREKPNPFSDLPVGPSFMMRNLQKHWVISSLTYAPMGGQSKTMFQFDLLDVSTKFLQNGQFLHQFDVDSCASALEKHKAHMEMQTQASLRPASTRTKKRNLKEILQIITQQNEPGGMRRGTSPMGAGISASKTSEARPPHPN